MNALISDWTAPFELPPFGKFKPEDFADAFDTAFSQAKADIEQIANQTEPPTFANTIAALEKSGALLERLGSLFFNLTGSDTNDVIEAYQRELSPRYAAFHSEMMMNEALFSRVKAVANSDAPLTAEERKVTDDSLKGFVRAGADLTGAARTRFKEVMQRLAALSTQFSQNVLAEEKAWQLELGEDDLEGLPELLVTSLKTAAEREGKDGYLLTLTPSLLGQFQKFSPRRDLKEQVSKAWKARGQQGGDHDNREIINEILALRWERAQLLGFEDFSHFKLEDEMAKKPDAVRALLEEVWTPAREKAVQEVDILAKMMRADGINDDLQPWDLAYYSEKRRQAEFEVNEAEVKPYLQLDNIIEAAFDCANRLFDLEFSPFEAEMYNADVRLWEVTKAGRHMGVFVADYYSRPSKRSGAWCSRLRPQSNMERDIRPIVVNVCNFTKPADGAPALLSFGEAETLFHEFGHALHHLLSDVTFPSISGTSVARDYVELPSQLYEHWLRLPEVLEKHARHKDTGAPIPAEMVENILAANYMNTGSQTVGFIASAMVDIDLHSGAAPLDAVETQAETLARIDMPAPVSMFHEAPHFQHVFSGDGYSSGYYSYMWSEVMDADAFAAFEETGNAFDKSTADRLEEFIYSAGGSQDPGALYVAFRGAMPKVDALLKRRRLVA